MHQPPQPSSPDMPANPTHLIQAAPGIEFIFLGTGTSGSLPNVSCLTAHESEAPCKTCLSTLKPEGKKNVRRNTSAVMRIDGKDGKKRYVLQRVVLRDRALMAVQDHRYRCRQEFPCGCCRVVSKVWPTTD